MPDLAHDPRYPVFGPAAAATGAASMLSTQLVVDNDDSLRASLNLYSRHPDAFDETAQTIARTVATHGALAAAAVVARDHTTNLERVLMDSRNIGMALGILMASLRLTTDEALTLLRTVSRNRNRTLSEIAADVVATGTLNHPEVPEFDGRGAG